MFVSDCHPQGVVEPISSRFGTRKIGDVTLARQQSRDFVRPISSLYLGTTTINDATIPCITTEKPRCRKHPFTVKLSSNREAQSKVQVIVVRVCYFLQKNRKTNEFIVLQEAKLRSHGTVHLWYRYMRTTNMSSAIFKRAICSK